MRQDSWITAEQAGQRLANLGYTVDQRPNQIAYRRTGVLGKITVHPQGVDEWALMRLEDRGS